MKKYFNRFFILYFLLGTHAALAQPKMYEAKFVDSITARLPLLRDDTAKVNNLATLAAMHLFVNPSLTIQYAKQGNEIARKLGYYQGMIACLGQSAFSFAISGEWAKATMDVNEAIPLCEKYNPVAMVYMCNIMVIIQSTRLDFEQALHWGQKAAQLPAFLVSPEFNKWPTYMQLCYVFESMNRIDSARYYGTILLNNIKKYAIQSPELTSDSYTALGNIALRQKEYKQAIQYYTLAGNNPVGLAKVYQGLQLTDSAIHYAKIGLAKGQVQKNPGQVQEASKILAAAYKESNPANANQYLDIYINSRDSLFSSDKIKQLELIKLTEQKNMFELEKRESSLRNLVTFIVLSAVLLIVIVISLLLWRNNRFKQKANIQLENAYADLKATQQQLIQSEKMASLGEVTAGIAHEIQNPLNFVNNFSELNSELITEMKDELAKGNFDEVRKIAGDIDENEKKILFHGKRADGIVKSMLEHSRSGNGQKEPSDINALVDEYLRLAYHGLRAKDKSFNAALKTDFDKSISRINIIPQDMGRVILNLITNAFYAVDEKKKQGVVGFVPEVTVTTHRMLSPAGEARILISVKDNGNGIPQHVIDKIFQPFFTTKPTGQGTGLGLSLSYDIVKAHGGELRVETKEAEGSEFIIVLPI
jgi:two-component system NtrC family sensor kinase